MTHAPETGALNPLHFSGADFCCVCHGPKRFKLLQLRRGNALGRNLNDSALPMRRQYRGIG